MIYILKGQVHALSRADLEKEFKRLVTKARRRKEVFRKRKIESPIWKKTEVLLQNIPQVNPFSAGVKGLTNRQLKSAIGIYERALNRPTSSYMGWMRAEKKRIASFGLPKDFANIEEVRKGVATGLDILESFAKEYDYDSKKYREFFIENYKKGRHFNLSEVEYEIRYYLDEQHTAGLPIYEEDIEQIFREVMHI